MDCQSTEKTKVVTDATKPDADPVPVQPEAGGGAPAPNQEQPPKRRGRPPKEDKAKLTEISSLTTDGFPIFEYISYL